VPLPELWRSFDCARLRFANSHSAQDDNLELFEFVIFMKNDEQNGRAKREEVCPSKKGKLDLDSLRAQVEAAADQKA